MTKLTLYTEDSYKQGVGLGLSTGAVLVLVFLAGINWLFGSEITIRQLLLTAMWIIVIEIVRVLWWRYHSNKASELRPRS